MPEPTILIAAISGRALAASARRAGFLPLVADCFGDDDTLALAHAHVHVHLDAKRGLDPERLLQALPQLSAAHHPIGLVYGAGFEDRPNLVARLAARWRLLGNAPNVLA